MFQQWGKGRNIVEQWCFSNGGQWEKGKKWCFSNGEKGRNIVESGVSAMGKMGKMRKMLLESDVSAMGKRAKYC
jgi:hypothetical protein